VRDESINKKMQMRVGRSTIWTKQRLNRCFPFVDISSRLSGEGQLNWESWYQKISKKKLLTNSFQF